MDPSYEVPILHNYESVVDAFAEFLTISIHVILYERHIYPSNSFLAARRYNVPVHQSRHPKVCQWVNDAVEAVRTELLKVIYLISLCLGVELRGDGVP